MLECNRLGELIQWTDLAFDERERTPTFAIQKDIYLHLAELSNLNAKK